jgi:hypothetical protein
MADKPIVREYLTPEHLDLARLGEETISPADSAARSTSTAMMCFLLEFCRFKRGRIA